MKALENIIVLTLSFFPTFFISELRKDEEERDYRKLMGMTFGVGILTLVKHLLHEHSAKFVNLSSSATEQTVRNLIFQKLVTANVTFLKTADESLATKLVIFNLSLVSKFIGHLPDLFSFPLIFTFSMIFFALYMGIYMLLALPIYIITWIIILIFIRKMVLKEVVIEYLSSKRSLIVMEILKKFKVLKTSNYEDYFNKKLEKVRTNELKYFNS